MKTVEETKPVNLLSRLTDTGAHQKLLAFASLIALLIAFSIASPNFMQTSNMIAILQATSVNGVLAIAATLVIITGGIDLSVGTLMTFCAVIAGVVLTYAGMPLPLGVIAAIGAGALCGLCSGTFVAKMKIPPFIATLGMMLIARGVALQLTGAAPISRLGEAFGTLGNGSLFRIVEETGGVFPKVVFPGIPYPAILLAVVAFAAAYLLNRRQVGRHIYATGSNEEAARLSGVLVDRTKIFAYTLSGALAGLAGNVLMSRLVTVQPNEGVMYELDAIAAAVIGGASLMGGVGNISGTMIGAFIIGVLRNGLNMAGVSAFIQQIVIGVIVIGAVYIDQIRNRR